MAFLRLIFFLLFSHPALSIYYSFSTHKRAHTYARTYTHTRTHTTVGL